MIEKKRGWADIKKTTRDSLIQNKISIYHEHPNLFFVRLYADTLNRLKLSFYLKETWKWFNLNLRLQKKLKGASLLILKFVWSLKI